MRKFCVYVRSRKVGAIGSFEPYMFTMIAETKPSNAEAIKKHYENFPDREHVRIEQIAEFENL